MKIMGLQTCQFLQINLSWPLAGISFTNLASLVSHISMFLQRIFTKLRIFTILNKGFEFPMLNVNNDKIPNSNQCTQTIPYCRPKRAEMYNLIQ